MHRLLPLVATLCVLGGQAFSADAPPAKAKHAKPDQKVKAKVPPPSAKTKPNAKPAKPAKPAEPAAPAKAPATKPTPLARA